jgi:alkanesulfonate monooxygenase SsuD/methylene tetrahydromethanopterin reductase-like flavin-dependent oxidoreductase (luciferase family)
VLGPERTGDGQGARFVHRPAQSALRQLSWGVHQHTRPIVDPAQPAKASGVDASRFFTARAGVRGTLGEAIFCSPADKPSAIALYDGLKARIIRRGRAPEDSAVLAWISVVLGETEAVARERLDHLLETTGDVWASSFGSTFATSSFAHARW